MSWFGKGKRSAETPRAGDVSLTRSNVPKVSRRRPQGAMRRRSYDSGASNRLSSAWTTSPLTAEDIIRRNWRVLVARSREQAANNDYGKAFIRRCCQNIIGARGFTLQAQAKERDQLDAGANRAIERAFAKWGKAGNCDVTGKMTWRQIQKAVVTSAAKDGEFFVRMVTGRDAGPWGFSLQVLDAVRCPVDLEQKDMPGGRFIRHGIEFNRYGRPLAYYFQTLEAHEIDYSFGGRDYTRVPADQIVHGYLTDIIGQKRGLPWMATSLLRMHHLKQFEQSALVNARESANKQGFIEWEEGYGPALEDDEEVEIESEAGVYHELPAGARFKGHAPQFPSGELQVFSKHMLRGISAGLGVAYNALANDLEGVNFSSIRQGVLDERDHWMDLQEWLIEGFALPVYEAWLTYSLLRQRITLDNGAALPAAKREKFLDVSFLARRWDWIDPQKDVNAAVEAKDNLLISPSQIIRDRGRDPRAVWQQVAQDIKDMEAAGIPPDIIATIIQRKTATGGPANGQEADGAGEPGAQTAQGADPGE